jgi:hypothetical protein
MCRCLLLEREVGEMEMVEDEMKRMIMSYFYAVWLFFVLAYEKKRSS